MARAMGIDPATRKYVPFDLTNKQFATNYMDIVLHPSKDRASTSGGSTGSRKRATTIAGVNLHMVVQLLSLLPIRKREGKRPLFFIGGEGLAIIAIRLVFPATLFPFGNRLPFSRGLPRPPPTWATPIGVTISAGTCPARSSLNFILRWIQWGSLQPDLANPYNEKSRRGTQDLGLPGTLRGSDAPVVRSRALCAATLHLHRGPKDIRYRASRFCTLFTTTGRTSTRCTTPETSTASATP